MAFKKNIQRKIQDEKEYKKAVTSREKQTAWNKIMSTRMCIGHAPYIQNVQ